MNALGEWKKLVLLVGPTASGKSQLALRTAQKWGAGIVNCDSLQVYRGLDIGTAKPTQEERKIVPHFLFDHIDVGQSYTAGDFRRDALEVLKKELTQRPLIAVGGSGFYIQALEKGMYDAPAASPESQRLVQSQMDEKGLGWAFEKLKSIDPLYADKIGPTDRYRIFRALVLYEDCGKTPTEVQKEFATKKTEMPWVWHKVGLKASREWLKKQVTMRVEKMVARGLKEEVKALLDRVGPEWAPLQSVGYKETLRHLAQELDEQEWQQAIVTSTMKLAKRQMTWFKRDPEIVWFNVEHGLEEAASYLDSLMGKNP